MKKLILITISLLCLSEVFAAATDTEETASGVDRYAVYIGSNKGGKGREQLLYAGSDAMNFQKTMSEIGGVSEVVCIQDKAVERLCSGWQKNGLGWQTETVPSKIPGCTNVILYYGSSTYDTAQMSRLLDLIIQECEQQGIPTLRDEATELLGKWGK